MLSEEKVLSALIEEKYETPWTVFLAAVELIQAAWRRYGHGMDLKKGLRKQKRRQPKEARQDNSEK